MNFFGFSPFVYSRKESSSFKKRVRLSATALEIFPLNGPKNSKLHAAPLTNGSRIGILHGAAQYVVQDKEGQISPTESISAGLDYPGISPLHCFLKDTKRAKYTSASDEDALDAFQLVSKLENISPSLEPSHAFAVCCKIAPKLSQDTVIIVNSCGDSLKDKDIIKKKLGSYIR